MKGRNLIIKTETMKKTITVLFFLTVVIYSIAQNPIGPPSLSAGVGGLVFEQGNLDASLIAEIVAMKQGEIKSELAQRLILNKLQCGNFAFYNYAKQNLDVLFSETNNDVIKKEVLQNSAELALVVGIAELYLADVMEKSKNAKLTGDAQVFFQEYVKWLDAETIKKYLPSMVKDPDALKKELKDTQKASGFQLANFDVFYTKGQSATDVLKEYNIYQDKNIDYYFVTKSLLDNNISEFSLKSFSNSNKTDNYLPPITYLSGLKNNISSYEEKSCKTCGNNFSPNQILIDLVFDICRNNEWVKKNGFFVRPLGISEEDYLKRNKYHSLQNWNKSMYESFSKIKMPLTNTIDFFFKYFYTITKINHDKLDTAVLKTAVDIFQEPTGYKKSNPDIFQKNIKTLLSSKQLKGKNDELFVYKTDSSEKQLLNDLLVLSEISLYKNKSNGSAGTLDETQLERALYTLRESIIPRLISLNINTSNSFYEILMECEFLYYALGCESFTLLQKDLAKIDIDKFNDFKKFFLTFGKLNEAETYEALLKLIADIGNIYSSKTVGKIFNTIVNVAEKYTVVDKGNNKLQIDVESMAVDLFKKYGEQNSSTVSMYFSVGVTNAYPWQPKGFINDTIKTTNINFVSEKLGVKVKLIDVARDRTLNGKRVNADMKPIVSDWHLVAYGSGLLYQIKALNTEHDFNKPIVGLSTGFTFFNGLDLNLGYAVPITGRPKLLQTGFWSLSFDIKILDYLSALRLKNKSKQSR